MDLKFSKIVHDHTMVADVYRAVDSNNEGFILKICSRARDYDNENIFLTHFKKQLQVPTIIKKLPPNEVNYGAILMKQCPGHILKPSLITRIIAFDLGQSIALIHNNKADGFGYLNQEHPLDLDPKKHFQEKFIEHIHECKNNLPTILIDQLYDYFDQTHHLIAKTDGPCLVHRDLRPGNIIADNHKLSGIIDWSSAKASFAEEDFFTIEHGGWGNFNRHKKSLLEGYSSIRKIPEYHHLMPLLQLNRALGIIGFLVKRQTWQTSDSSIYLTNRQFIDHFFKNR